MEKERFILLAGVIAVAGAAFWLSRRDLSDTRISGTIEQDEARLGFRVSGRLDRLDVREGDAVTNGQSLAHLEAPELQARQQAAAARLAELESGARPQEVAAARSESAALQAESVFARQEAERAEKLAASGTLSAEALDGARLKKEATDRRWHAAQDRLALIEAGPREEQRQQARAQLAEAESLSAETVLYAPEAGTVDQLHAREGEILAAHAPVLTLVYQRAPWVRIFVTESWLPSLSTGAVLEVTCPSVPGRTWPGEVIQLARRAEFTPRNVQTEADRMRQVFGVKLRLPAGDALLRPGMTAEVRLSHKER